MNRRGRIIGISVISIVTTSIALPIALSSGSGRNYTYAGPTCVANSASCSQTSDGYWIPLWYWTSLQSAQNTTAAPTTYGSQPTEEEDETNGASPIEATVASADSSADDATSDGTDDSGDDDSGDDDGGDDSGGDDGGDDDGGGDDGGGDDGGGDDGGD
jgi:hypothetical protein